MRSSWEQAGRDAACTSCAIYSRSCPKTARAWCWPRSGSIFQQPDNVRAKDELRALADRLQERLPGWPFSFLRRRGDPCSYGVPRRAPEASLLHQPLERLNKEINRRTRVVRHLPRREEPHASCRRGLVRAERRVGRLPQIHESSLARAHLPVQHSGDRRRGDPRRCYSRPLETKLGDLREHGWLLHHIVGRYPMTLP
jgi:transposase-like protein